MLFHHEADTRERIYVAMDPAHVREIIAVFEDPGHAERYALNFNGEHAWTDRASKARVIVGDGVAFEHMLDTSKLTLTFYVVVRGRVATEDLIMFERGETAKDFAAGFDGPMAAYAVPLFAHTNALIPAPPKPNGHWAPTYLTADLALFADVAGEQYVLLVRRSFESDACPGMWALPGGFVEPDETSRAAAVRETGEETGLFVDADELVLVAMADKPGRDSRGRIVSAVYATVTDHLRPPAAGDDADEARWFPLVEALAAPLAFDHNEQLQNAAAAIGEI